MEFVTFLILTALFLFICSLFVNNDKRKSLIDQFPGPKSYPIVGSTLPFLFLEKHETFERIRSFAKTYGPIYRTWLGKSPLLHMTDPQYVELILNNSTHISKGLVYRFVLPWLGDGLLTSKGAKWHRHRKLLTPAFHFKILEAFMSVFVEKSELLVKILEKEAGENKSFNIFPYITHCTLDIITETAMGIQVNALSKGTNKYVAAVYGACEAIASRITRAWYALDFIFYNTQNGKNFLKHVATLHNTTNKVIHERKAALRHKESSTSEDDFGRKKRQAFLDLLIEVSKDGTVLTHEQIREEVDTFMFEGHDTTTASISWTIFLLGLHPDIQEKTYQEVNKILQDGKSLEFADLNELKYLERVLKESLRLYPSVPTISRFTSQEIKLDNYTIPTDTSVAMHIFDVHRNEKYFPDPTKFDPDRFLPENSKNRHPYAYIPFSAGPRNCIGQKFALNEEKTILAYIIKHYQIKSLQTVSNVQPVNDLVLRPNKGLYVNLQKRIN